MRILLLNLLSGGHWCSLSPVLAWRSRPPRVPASSIQAGPGESPRDIPGQKLQVVLPAPGPMGPDKAPGESQLCFACPRPDLVPRGN